MVQTASSNCATGRDHFRAGPVCEPALSPKAFWALFDSGRRESRGEHTERQEGGGDDGGGARPVVQDQLTDHPLLLAAFSKRAWRGISSATVTRTPTSPHAAFPSTRDNGGNGEGSITRHKKSGLYMARYTVETPAGGKRKSIYANEGSTTRGLRSLRKALPGSRVEAGAGGRPE